ncbi:MAG: hypothetical protein WBW34_04995, partial [Nitrososphaeraceae archaeon]
NKVGNYGPNDSFRESLLCIIMRTRAEDYFLICKIVLALALRSSIYAFLVNFFTTVFLLTSGEILTYVSTYH